MDKDFESVKRYIECSYLPSHFEVCRKMVDNYSKLHGLDIFGAAMLVDALEMKGGYDESLA